MARGILWLTLPSQQLPGQLSELRGGFVPARHLHATLQFGVNSDTFDPALLGQLVPVTVTNVCYNERIQALRVTLPEPFRALCQNNHPHMTVGHLPDVKPVESNAMLSGEHTAEPCNVTLNLEVEFFAFS